MKVHVVGYENSMTEFHRLVQGIVEPDLNKADLVIFTGGADINPTLYNSAKHPFTGPINHERDVIELGVFKYAINKGIPILGICRGSQLICALSGNSLLQHVNNHGSSNPHSILFKEPITLPNGEILNECSFTGTHHQMMKIDRDDAICLAVAKNLKNPEEKVATVAYAGDPDHVLDVSNIQENEIVHFTNTRALGIQSHPEWNLGQKYTKEIIQTLINNTIFKT